MDFPTLLPQVFMLGRRGPGDYTFRLVGGFVRDLHGHDLRDFGFSNLWAQNARLPIQTALESARRRVEPVRIAAEVQARTNTLDMEIALLPLAGSTGEIDRFLGFYEPRGNIARLRGQPADRLQLLRLGDTTQAETPRLRLAAVGGQRVG